MAMPISVMKFNAGTKSGGPRKNKAVCFALFLTAGLLPAQTFRDYTADLENRNPAVGSLLIMITGPNPFGFPVGIAAFCSGALIADRVFLTAGHCVGPSLPELPPFASAYVSFSPRVLDQSTWIPVATQAAHPSLPPCAPPTGCDPTSTGAFVAGDPAVTDLGLVFLSRSPRINPVPLATPGSLEHWQSGLIPMTTIGYGHEFPDDHYLSVWDGLRKFRTSKLSKVLNGVWAAWELPSSVCYGDSGAPTFLNNPPDILKDRRSIVAIASDGGADCLNKDIRVRVDTWAVQQWIKGTVSGRLGPEAVRQLEIR
jgi:Trypsin